MLTKSMENRISSTVGDRNIVTKNLNKLSNKDAQLSKKLTYPQGLNYRVGNYHALGCNGGFGDSSLFLGMSINKIRTKKTSITSG